MQSKILFYLCAFCFSALGMWFGQWVSHHWSPIPSCLAATPSNDTLSTRSLAIADSQNRRRIFLGTTEQDDPAIWFFDQNGKNRLTLGLYEDGQPYLVLNDDNQQAIEIFRTYGTPHAPVLVMKAHGQDRLVMGLNPTDQNPFLTYFDEKGAQTNLFGAWKH